ncbi:MAG TPA: hypothetical protein VGD64_01850 [Acidisarcina sp.]
MTPSFPASAKAAGEVTTNPDELELAPGTKHENLEGWIPELATESEVVEALEKAFDYRGDVTLTLRDGSRVEGYIFDRRSGRSLAESSVKLFPVNSSQKLTVSYAEIARLEFSGKDRAAGKHWENWVQQYEKKKAAGETNIGLHPDALE